LSHKQAADLLGISAKAVETRAYRARAALAQALSAVVNEG
jgi:DNA-directed RNA polymerase specialized sigma24 family protein